MTKIKYNNSNKKKTMTIQTAKVINRNNHQQSNSNKTNNIYLINTIITNHHNLDNQIILR